MASGQLYHHDICAWSEQQAAVLRRLAETPGRLPNELDLEHLAGEIEDVGKSQRDAAESSIRLILVHLIELAVAPQSDAVDHWRSEIVSFHIELLSKLTPAMWNRIDLDRLWPLAKWQARARLKEERTFDAAAPLWTNVTRCPVDLATLAADDFDIDEALARLGA